MEDTILGAVDAYISAYNSRNVTALVNLYTDDAVLEDPVGYPVTAGRASIEEFWRNAVQYEMTLAKSGPILVCGNEAAVAMRVQIETPEGAKELDIVDIMAFSGDGRISSVRAFYDVSAMAQLSMS